MGCILAKKVNIDRILSVLMVFKCLGCHFVDNLLSNGSEKSVYVRESTSVSVYCEPGGMGIWVLINCSFIFPVQLKFLKIKSVGKIGHCGCVPTLEFLFCLLVLCFYITAPIKKKLRL